MSNVATIDRPSGPSITVAMADRYGMAPAAFEATLRATVVPKECTREQFAAFLLVAHEYGLNPVLKEIYAFPAKGGGIQPVVSIDGWVKLMNSHPQMDGIEFDDHVDEKKQLTAISARIYRKDRSHPIVVTEYMAECKRGTEPWKQWPHRMLRHKATIQAARYAFGYSNIFDPDEAERMGADVSGMRDVSPPPAPPPAPRVREIAASPAHDAETGEVIEDDPGGNRRPADGDGGNAAEPSATAAPPTTRAPAPATSADTNEGGQASETEASGNEAAGEGSASPAAPAADPPPLTADDRKRLKTFADALASVNTPGAIDKGASRFWSDNAIEDEASPLALAANEIVKAQLGRTRGEISIADADAAVRKVLPL